MQKAHTFTPLGATYSHVSRTHNGGARIFHWIGRSPTNSSVTKNVIWKTSSHLFVRAFNKVSTCRESSRIDWYVGRRVGTNNIPQFLPVAGLIGRWAPIPRNPRSKLLVHRTRPMTCHHITDHPHLLDGGNAQFCCSVDLREHTELHSENRYHFLCLFGSFPFRHSLPEKSPWTPEELTILAASPCH